MTNEECQKKLVLMHQAPEERWGIGRTRKYRFFSEGRRWEGPSAGIERGGDRDDDDEYDGREEEEEDE